MLKVFLVEDEFVVREGMKKNIDWVGNHLELCGEAADGELAYSQILKVKPDIVITDIQMPFMDGLALSRMVKAQLPACKIIIISGHEEFNYAREAIKIGVTEYLLKPFSREQITQVLEQVVEEIIQEEKAQEHMKRYEQEMAVSIEVKKAQLFHHMMTGEGTTVTLVEAASEVGFDLMGDIYEVGLVRYDQLQERREMILETSMVRLISSLEKELQQLLVFDQGLLGLTLLLVDDKGQGYDKEKQILERTIMAYMQEHQISYQLVWGKPVRRISQLSESYGWAEEAYRNLFLKANPDEPLDHHLLSGVDFKSAKDFLKKGSLEGLEAFVVSFTGQIMGRGDHSLLFRQYIVMNLYLGVVDYMKEIETIEAFNQIYPLDGQALNEHIDQFASLKAYMSNLYKIALQLRDQRVGLQYPQFVEAAMTYCQQHYMDEEISLNQVAKEVGVNASYFSSVFSQTTGKTFVRYLTDLRMQEAKDLLRTTSLRCSEVGYQVGYKDPHYFSFIFKKEVSLSPMKYRSQERTFDGGGK